MDAPNIEGSPGARRLPAEWEPQDGVLLTWPHADSDWAPILAEVEPVFVEIAVAIARSERLVVACHDGALQARVEALLRAAGVDAGAAADAHARLFCVPSDDTWARDHGPICVTDGGAAPLPLSFRFRGWGGKFPAERDDAITGALSALGAFARDARRLELELEGGAIESDGRGTLLTTRSCVLNANRNDGGIRLADAERAFAQQFGAHRVLWLSHGHLEGDDTDSHIDTLVRLAPGADGRGETLVYQGCDDADDPHHADLSAMRDELRALRTATGTPYTLLALPWPQAQHDDVGERLPATYANYLILNDAVLVPTYDDPADAAALQVVAMAHPGRAILGIDCRWLIWQHGSLHCVTMQLPRGSLRRGGER